MNEQDMQVQVQTIRMMSEVMDRANKFVYGLTDTQLEDFIFLMSYLAKMGSTACFELSGFAQGIISANMGEPRSHSANLDKQLGALSSILDMSSDVDNNGSYL